MITILHGENNIRSRAALISLITEAKNQGKQIITLSGGLLTASQLETASSGSTLFGSPHFVIVEELHSLPKSKKKDQLIEIVSSSTTDLVLWEKKTLTATQLKKFPQAKITLYKISNSLFTWLDSLSPNQKTKSQQILLLKAALQDNGDFMCFTMLIRQIRLLIQAAEHAPLKGAPFMIAKLKKQASQFTVSQLLAIHSQLFTIDVQLKTSQGVLPLAAQLDLLIMKM